MQITHESLDAGIPRQIADDRAAIGIKKDAAHNLFVVVHESDSRKITVYRRLDVSKIAVRVSRSEFSLHLRPSDGQVLLFNTEHGIYQPIKLATHRCNSAGSANDDHKDAELIANPSVQTKGTLSSSLVE